MPSTLGIASRMSGTGELSPLLKLVDLNVRFDTPDGVVHAVRDVNLEFRQGEIFGLVGESGCGKTQLFLAILGLIASNGRVTGSAKIDDREMCGLSENVLNRIRGNDVSMVFQDPMSSLNPYLTIGTQLSEVLTTHSGYRAADARRLSIDMLGQVGIADARERFNHYPHELSGGMRQRIMIAMALLAEPKLLIADEATTALDVTVQAQILDLLRDLNEATGTAIVIITHDLGVVAETCERVAVMYAGRIVETGFVDKLFYDPRHPYTTGLLKSVPRVDDPSLADLPAIPGQPPDLRLLEQGCAFAPRCPDRHPRCEVERPALRMFEPEREKACHLNGP